MIADKITLLEGLLGFNRRQFIIPIYQRKYKRTGEQCNRLIDDLVKAGKEGKEHFTGTVVYQEPSTGSFKKAFLVDGQQRVTTTLLMIKALNIISSEKCNDEDYKYVFDMTHSFLFADEKDEKRGFKLVPSKNDEATFNLIMRAKSFDEVKSDERISKSTDDFLYNNFKTIFERFLKLDTCGNVLRNTILEGMFLLTIVEMSLEKEDDPQAIFECINSLGLKLTNADLIRNYLLMSNERQKELYEQYWEVIQDKYIQENNMESFVFNYLMMKRSYTINNDDVYKEYVKYAIETFNGKEINKEALLKDLFYTAKIYQSFIRDSKAYTPNTNMLMQELRDMSQTTAYPFLMRVFLDKEAGIIADEVLDKVINLIIVYLVRRTICGVPTHSLRGFMLNLYNRVFKIKENKERYYESVYAFLTQLETRDRLRGIDEVYDSLQNAEIYKNVKFATYLLYKIENGRYPNAYKEFTLANSVSVEHIIPQTLTDEWIVILGEDAEDIHKQYLNTIGNLSLSSRSKNTIMSNESFVTKRDILLSAGSKFIELNKDITKDQTTFGKDEIIKRFERLAEIVCSKYELEEVNTDGIKFEDSVEIVCSTDYEEIFNSSTPIAYKLFGIEKPIDSFSKIIVEVAKKLLELKPELMRELAKEKYNPWDNGGRDCIHYTNDENDKDQLIGEDIRISTNCNAIYCVQFIALLMERFDIDSSQLSIFLKKDSLKMDTFLPKRKRIEIVRSALEKLNNDGLLIYDPKNMPKSDSWIKFKTKKLIETFPFDGETKWDGESFNSVSYLEYNLSNHKIVLTIKAIKKTESFIGKIKSHVDELEINETCSSTYWHLKEYPIDYKNIYEATDKIEEMRKQIGDLLVIIDKDISKIFEILNK